jgi:hypothetical protein
VTQPEALAAAIQFYFDGEAHAGSLDLFHTKHDLR